MLRSSLLHPRNQIAVFVNGEKKAETGKHAKFPFNGVTRVNFDLEQLVIEDVPSDAEVTLVAYENSFPNLHVNEVGRATLYLGNVVWDELMGMPMKVNINQSRGWTVYRSLHHIGPH